MCTYNSKKVTRKAQGRLPGILTTTQLDISPTRLPLEWGGEGGRKTFYVGAIPNIGSFLVRSYL
jgi:hypothetical protein